LSISTAPEEIFTQLQQEATKVDVLVNKAGFASYGLFYETNMTEDTIILCPMPHALYSSNNNDKGHKWL
jgi:short-subunit dehydrogenase